MGAIIGSFLATVALRWPQGEQATRGRSRCDGCGKPLAPLELVPILSWAVQRGRCRACGARIDTTHLRVELAAAAIGAGALALAPSAPGFALAALGWQLLLLGLLDARHFWLPRMLSLLLLASGLVLGGTAMAAIGIPLSLTDGIIGAAAGGGGLWLIATLYRLIRHREGLGGGDPLFFAGVGAWTGWMTLPLLLLLAAVAGLAVALMRGLHRDSRLPFGTLIALATAPALLLSSLLSPYGRNRAMMIDVETAHAIDQTETSLAPIRNTP